MHLDISLVPMNLGKFNCQLACGNGCRRTRYLSLAAKVLSVFCFGAAAWYEADTGYLVRIYDRNVCYLYEWHSSIVGEIFFQPNVKVWHATLKARMMSERVVQGRCHYRLVRSW